MRSSKEIALNLKISLMNTGFNIVVNMIKSAKTNFYMKALVNAKGNSRKLWGLFKDEIRKFKTTPSPVLKIEGE